ncbi:unnamed protein product [Phaeothamnion confervicola]
MASRLPRRADLKTFLSFRTGSFDNHRTDIASLPRRTMPPFYTIRINQGNDFRNVKTGSRKLSPVCQLKMNSQQYRTTVRKDTAGRLIWQEDAVFEAQDDTNPILEVEVFDACEPDDAKWVSLGKAALSADPKRKERLVVLFGKTRRGENERAGTVTLGITYSLTKPATSNLAPAADPVSPTGSAASLNGSTKSLFASNGSPGTVAPAATATMPTTPTSNIVDPIPSLKSSNGDASGAAARDGAAAAAAAPAAEPVTLPEASAVLQTTAEGEAIAEPVKAAINKAAAAMAAAKTAVVSKAGGHSWYSFAVIACTLALLALLQGLKSSSAGGNGGGGAGGRPAAEPVVLLPGGLSIGKAKASSTHFLLLDGTGNIILGEGAEPTAEAQRLWESGTAGKRCRAPLCRAAVTREGAIVLKRGFKTVASISLAEVEELSRYVTIAAAPGDGQKA